MESNKSCSIKVWKEFLIFCYCFELYKALDQIDWLQRQITTKDTQLINQQLLHVQSKALLMDKTNLPCTQRIRSFFNRKKTAQNEARSETLPRTNVLLNKALGDKPPKRTRYVSHFMKIILSHASKIILKGFQMFFVSLGQIS